MSVERMFSMTPPPDPSAQVARVHARRCAVVGCLCVPWMHCQHRFKLLLRPCVFLAREQQQAVV